jgi:hypothetical protein
LTQIRKELAIAGGHHAADDAERYDQQPAEQRETYRNALLRAEMLQERDCAHFLEAYAV